MLKNLRKNIVPFLYKWRKVQIVKPQLFIVGTQKGGTTSLFSYLSQHPNMVTPLIKEPQFFIRDEFYALGEMWYDQHFCKKIKDIRPNEKYVAFDATPDNIYLPYAAKRIQKYDASSKILIILREPVSRAYSAWNMFKQIYEKLKNVPLLKVQHKLTPSYIDDAPNNLRLVLEAEGGFPSFERLVHIEMEMIAQKSPYYEPGFIRRGLYFEQIKIYHDTFGKENVKILSNKQLKNKPIETLNEILNFVDLPSYHWNELDLSPRNVYAYDAPMNDAIKQQLTAFYEPHNAKLFEYLGHEIKW